MSKNTPKIFYLGTTSNIKKRLKEYNSKENSDWSKRYKWILVYYEAYTTKKYAIEREKLLKLSHSMKTHLLNRVKKSLIKW